MAIKRKRTRNITLNQAIRGHLVHCRSAAYSEHTLSDYQNTFRQLLEFLDGETIINDIKPAQIESFMAFKAAEPFNACQGVVAEYDNGKTRNRSAKTLRNYHTALSSLWTWATENSYAGQHIIRQVQPPKVHQPPIQPLSAADVIALLRACDESKPWHNKPLTRNYRPSAERDKAIIAIFVETAIRADELVKLRIRDVTFNQHGGQLMVHEGKGGKSRWVPFSRRCAKYLHDWLLIRRQTGADDPLFVNLKRNFGLPMTRQVVARNIKRLGQKTGIHVTPHRLRTTAACMMVRNGMTGWELQRIMGHSDITTTMRYVRAARIDLDLAMANASPLDNLRL